MTRTTPWALLASAMLAAGASPSFALLGSFTAADGYQPQYGTAYGEVSYYNAGQNGANAGGGPLTQIVADSGLWKLVSPVGGTFTNAVDRAAYLAPGPGSYPPTSGANGVPAYILGGHFPGRNFDGQNLALRNDTPTGTGPMIYEYSIDSYDFDGVNPASITAGPVDIEFYFCPNPGDAPDPTGASSDKFTMSFKDSAGNVGFEWGYQRDNSVVWRTSSSNPWTTTSFVADQSNWDGLQVHIDLTSDTFGVDYYDVSTNILSNLVPVGTPLGMPMQDVTIIRWRLEDGVASGTGGKNYFDDFNFTVVPEPVGAALALVAVAPSLRRRVR